MDFLTQIFATDQWLWTAWLVLMVAIALCARVLIRKFRFRPPQELHTGDSGAAYTLGVVLTLPLFLLLCGMALEVTFLIIAKVGTVYAAYAGARAMAVWETMPGNLVNERVNQAIVSGMAPFAASAGFDPNTNPATSADLPVYAPRMATEYSRAIQKSAAPERLDRRDIEQHFLRVFNRIESKTTVSRREHGGEIIVQVRYSAPLIVPGVAPFLDDDHRSPWEYLLTANVRMTLEAPKSQDGTLGIEYRPF